VSRQKPPTEHVWDCDLACGHRVTITQAFRGIPTRYLMCLGPKHPPAAKLVLAATERPPEPDGQPRTSRSTKATQPRLLDA
jgi:hypothetical protein